MQSYVWYVRGYKTKIGYVRKVLCAEKKAAFSALCTWYSMYVKIPLVQYKEKSVQKS
jgi:hypothetical protein